ncbi:MAG: branched-chain amino acid ABC transporter substrate-binding protein, partial [Gemmatimonadota bacterium]
MKNLSIAALLAALATGAAGAARAQDSIPLQAGIMAPDFELPGATREGLAGPIRLSDFRDQTVVIAFFY